MQQGELQIRVFRIPGGERDALHVYEELAHLLETHVERTLTAYRGQNQRDGTWVIILIGEATSFIRYQKPLQQPLTRVQAQRVVIPPERLMPLVESFLLTHVEMLLANETFVEKHRTTMASQDAEKRDQEY